MKTLPVAFQLYSIREEANDDFIKAIQELKKMGYEGVELAGLYGYSPEQIRDILKEIGLVPISAHVPYEAFLEDLQGTIESYALIGCRYVAIPYLTEGNRYGTENFKEFMEQIPVIARACNEAGLGLLYHNHDFEFQKTAEGEYILDYMYRLQPKELLKVELDTCWAKYSGVDPVGYLGKYDKRCPVIHVKDYNGAEPFEFRPLGYGVQNIPAILEQAVAVGCEWIIAEQDGHTEHTGLEDARLSKEYLKTLGW